MSSDGIMNSRAPLTPGQQAQAEPNPLLPQGVETPDAEAGNVLVHLIDIARHSGRFDEATTRALMALETSPE